MYNNPTLTLHPTAMASTSSKIQQCSAAFACILLGLFTSSASAAPLPPWLQDVSSNEPSPTEPSTAEGFHFKLSEDILVNATEDAVLKDYTITDLGRNQELFSETNSGLDNNAGIFRPSTDYYFLSTLVHVAVVAQEGSQTSENDTDNSENKPRVTVSICINAHCGNSA